jgi:glycosyltransferase involved in cell wall biosynthesis
MSPSILWIASHLFHPSGHSEEARGFLAALEAAGAEPSVLELSGWGRHTPLAEDELVRLVRQLERQPTPPTVAVHHYVPRPGRGILEGAAANVGRYMWETDRLPGGWLELFEDRDAIWVPSRHNYETFAAAGVPEHKLRLVHQTLDFDAYRPGVEPYPLGVPEGHFAFLSNFDFSERKGWRQLLLAWARAFGRHDPVCLVLKTLSVAEWPESYVNERVSHFIDNNLGPGARERMAPVVVVAEPLPSPEMPRVYAAADAFVCPSRGEAWGRTYMEAMAMELPTIGTRFSGNLDFMTDANSWLVDGEVVAVAEGAEVLDELYRGQHWFEADVDELADAMREIAGDPDAARRRAAPARRELIERFAPELVAAQVMRAAEEVLALADERFARVGGEAGHGLA